MSSIGRIVRKNHSVLFWSSMHYPKAKREAVYTIYALVKHFDDLSTSNLTSKEKQDILNAWKEEIHNIYEKKVPATAIGRRIYKNCMRFKFPQKDLEDILASFSMDCPKPLCCPSKKKFEDYCRGVAEIPSCLILKVIAEFDEETTTELGTLIGRAVEITNALKDLKEDMLNGHVYLPKEFLKSAEIDPLLSPKEILTHTNLYVARQKLADIARQSYQRAYAILEEKHNKNSKPIVYMLNLYHTYFELMDKRGWEVISPKPQLKFKDSIKLIYRAIFGRVIA